LKVLDEIYKIYTYASFGEKNPFAPLRPHFFYFRIISQILVILV